MDIIYSNIKKISASQLEKKFDARRLNVGQRLANVRFGFGKPGLRIHKLRYGADACLIVLAHHRVICFCCFQPFTGGQVQMREASKKDSAMPVVCVGKFIRAAHSAPASKAVFVSHEGHARPNSPPTFASQKQDGSLPQSAIPISQQGRKHIG